MTPSDRARAALQEHILDEVKASSGAKDLEIADWAGCDRTMVSHWRSGTRPMSVQDLLGLIRGMGDARPVLQRLAAAGDCDVTRRVEASTGDVVGRALAAMAGSGALVRELAEALADGRVDEGEKARLRSSMRAHRTAMDQLDAELREASGR